MRGPGEACVDGAPPGTSYIYCPVISFTAHRPHGNVDVRASLSHTHARFLSFFLSLTFTFFASFLLSYFFPFMLGLLNSLNNPVSFIFLSFFFISFPSTIHHSNPSILSSVLSLPFPFSYSLPPIFPPSYLPSLPSYLPNFPPSYFLLSLPPSYLPSSPPSFPSYPPSLLRPPVPPSSHIYSRDFANEAMNATSNGRD